MLCVLLVPAAAGRSPVLVRHLPGCRRPLIDSQRDRVACERRGRAWWRRHHPVPAVALSVGVASWYEDGGATASGFHATYGVAHLSLPFGTRLLICHTGCVQAVVDDRGPYVGGRVLDLNAATKAAIGCLDLCVVRWGVLRR